jgi:nucleoside-diphosphate kinase
MNLEDERTLVIIKPDGIQRSLMGEIIQRFERVGLKFIAFNFVVPTAAQVVEHYHKDDAWCTRKGEGIVKNRQEHNLPIEKDALGYGREIIDHLVKFMTSGPVLAVVLQGNEAVGVVTKLVGSTEPLTSDVGTIRGDYTIESYRHTALSGRAIRNLIHCSESPAEAAREIAVWFKPEQLIDYRLVQEQILYDVNLDGILE